MKSSYGTVAKGFSLWIRERRVRQRMDRANKRFDAFIVSFPKAGRTWHRAMLGYYLARLSNSDPRELFDLDALCERTGIKRISYTHNGSDYASRLPVANTLVASPREWTSKDVLLLVRNPGDMLVSAYHHARFRQDRFSGDISDFIRAENTGIDKLLVAHNRWYANRHRAKTFATCAYEQMLRAPDKALRQALSFVGLRELDSTLISEAVEFGSFDNMRRLEEQGFFSSRLRRIKLSESGRKVRRGSSGGVQELSAEDQRTIAERTAVLGNPFSDIGTIDAEPVT